MENKGHRKLKVAIIHPDLGIGGAERLIVDAAVELASRGHSVHVFTAHHDKSRCFEETMSGKFQVAVYGSFLPRHLFYRFHAVGKDLLLAQHTTWLRRMYRKPIDLLEEKTTGMANLILVNSRFTKSTFATTFRGLHSRGIEPAVLYPAVNVSQFREQCSYKRLKENVEYLEELKQLAEVDGVSNRVMFITSCSTEERNTLLSQCLCVLYTPENEHFGIVPLEAMASQKPVIACNSGGPMETVKDEVTGFLCEPTPSEFSKAMAKLLSDGELAVRMGREARRHVAEMFSTKTFGDQLNRYVLDTYHHRIE